MTAQQIYDAILKYVGSSNFGQWYIGITNNVEERLFGYHNVDRTFGAWLHAPALLDADSRLVESSLLKLGFDGGDGGGNHTATHVYVFRKDYGTVR